MGIQTVFERYELKYMLTERQAALLKNEMKERMCEDPYGESLVCNLYFDTPDYLLIRRSLEGPVYKEKLRLRSYGVVGKDGTVFPEIKKKYKGIVYKRRIVMTDGKAEECLSGKEPLPDTQIGHEISYCFVRYRDLKPRVYISYEREGYFDRAGSPFRMTFDRNILWRTDDLTLCGKVYGTAILPEDRVLLEVKTSDSVPVWLAHFLAQNGVYRTSFSKYGCAYCSMIGEDMGRGGLQHAS